MRRSFLILQKERHQLWQGLKEEWQAFSWKSLPAQFAIRSALAVIIALYVSWWLSLDNAAWAAISAIMASQSTMGGTVSKSIFRVCGTLMGGFLGFLINAYFLDNILLYLLAGTLVCSMAFYMASRDPYYTYSWTVIAITCSLVMYSGAMLAHPSVSQVYEIFVYRTTEVVIGVISASLCAIAVFPQLSTRTARKQITEIFDAFPVLLQGLEQRLNGQDDSVGFYECFTKQAEKINDLHNLLLTIRFERRVRHLNVPYERVEQSLRNIEQAIIYAYDRIEPSSNISLLNIINLFQQVINVVINPQIQAKQCHFIRQDFKDLIIEITQTKNTIVMLKGHNTHKVLVDLLNALERNILLLCDDDQSQQDIRMIAQITAWSSFDYIAYTLREAFGHGVRWRQFTIPLLYGISVNISVYLWALIGWQEIAAVAITMCVCMTFNPQVSRYKGVQRISGCALGCVFAMIILGLSISSTVEILICTFIALFITQYIGGGRASVAYFGLQASIPIALGVFQNLSPATSDVVAIERLMSIFFGVLTVSLLEWAFVANRPSKVMTNVLIDLRRSVQALIGYIGGHQTQYDIGAVKYHFIGMRRVIQNIRGIKTDDPILQSLQQQAIACATKTYRLCYASYYNHHFDSTIVKGDHALLEQVQQALDHYEVDQDNFELQRKTFEQLRQNMSKSDQNKSPYFILEIIQQLEFQYQIAIELLQYEKNTSLQ